MTQSAPKRGWSGGWIALLAVLLHFSPALGAANDITITNLAPSGIFVADNATGVVVHCFKLEADIGGSKTLKGARFMASGTLADHTALTNAQLVREGTTKDCVYAGDDVVIGTASYSGDNGSVSFTGLTTNIGGGPAAAEQFMLIYNLNGTGAATQTFTARLDSLLEADLNIDLFGTSTEANKLGPPPPFNGATHTVRGSLTLAAGANNPAAKNVPRGSSDETLLQFSLTASNGENITLRGINLTPVSSFDDSNVGNLTKVDIIVDANGNGLKDGGETPLTTTPNIFTGNDATTTFDINPDYTINAGQTVNFIVVEQLATPPAGSTVAIAVTSASVDIDALGATTAQAAQQPGSLTGSTHTITGKVTVAPSANAPTAGNIQASDAGVLMLGVTLTETTGAEAINLTSIALTPSGTGPDASGGVTSVRFCLDVNRDGDCVDAGDFPVSTTPTTYAADNTEQVFSVNGDVDLTASAAVDLLMYYTYSAALTGGMTFATALPAPSDFVISGVTSAATLSAGAAVGQSYPFNGPTKTALGDVTVANGDQQPGSERSVTPGQTGVIQRQIKFTAGTEEAIEIQSIKLSPAGSGNDATDITAVKFYLDGGTTPGAVDGGDTLITSTPATFATNEVPLTFSFSGTLPSIPANSSAQILVVYDISSGLVSGAGNAYSTGISNSFDITYRGATSGVTFDSNTNPTHVSHTLSDGLAAYLTGVASLTSYAVPAVSLPANVLSMSVAGFTVTASNLEDLTFNALYFDESGTDGTAAAQVGEIVVWEDNATTADKIISQADGDTQRQGQGTVNYGGTTTALYRFNSPITITKNTSKNFLVGYNMGASPSVDQTHIVTVNPAKVEISGSTSLRNITVSGSSVVGPTHKVKGSVTAVANINLSASTPSLVTGAPNQAIQWLRITLSAAEIGQLSSIKLTPAGTGNDATNISNVRFYLDNGTETGRVDSGDTPLPTTNSTYTADNTANTFFFTSPVTLTSGTFTDLLVAYDLQATTAVAGLGAFQSSLAKPAVDLVITGANSGVRLIPLAGSQPDMVADTGTGLATVPSVTVATAGGNPAAGRLLEGSGLQVVTMFTVTGSSNGTSEITHIGLTPAGTGNDQTHLVSARLWLDADGNGQFSQTLDTNLNTSVTTFTADNTYNIFPLNTTVTLTPGQSKDIFVVYYLQAAGTSQPGTTFSVAPPNPGTSRTTPAVVWRENAVTGGQTANWPLGSATGNLHTVTGRVTVTNGTLSFASPNVSGSVQNLHMADFTLQPFGEDFNNVMFTLTPSGTGDDLADISQLRVCVDGSQPGCADDSANLCTLNASTYTANDTARTFTITGGIGTCAGNLTGPRNYAVDYNLGGTASAGETFTLALTNVSATGVSSSQAVLTTSYTVTPATATVRGSVAVALGASNPAAGNVAWNDQDSEVFQLAVTVGPEENVLFKSIRVQPEPVSGAMGLLNDATETTAVKLYVDTNGNGVVDGGDTLLTTTPTTFAANDTALSFSINGGAGYTITKNTTANFLLSYALSAATGSAGRQVGGQLLNSTYLQFEGASSAQVYDPTGTFPVNANTKKVHGNITLQLGSNNPGAQSVGTTISASYLQFALVNDSFEPFNLNSVAITPSGSGDDNAELTSVSIYLDVDNDGVYDEGGDCGVAVQTSGYIANDTKTTFNLDTVSSSCRVIAPGTTANFIVVAKTDPAADAGDTFKASIAALSDVVLTSANGVVAGVNPAGTVPITGNDMVINGTVSVAAAASNPAAAAVNADQAGVPVLRFAVSALTENTRIDRIDLRDVGVGAAASMNDATAISAVKFYLDEGSVPGQVDGTDTLLSTTPNVFGTDITDAVEQQFTINGGYIVNAGQTRNLLVVLDFSGNVSPSKKLQYQIANPVNDVVAFGLSTSTTINASGAAVAGNQFTVKGKMFVTLSPTTPPAQGIRATSSDQAIFSLDITAGEESVILSKVRLKPTGSGNDQTGVSAVKFYFDTGTKGVVDGETAITASGGNTFPADETAFEFGLGGLAGSRTVSAGQTRSLLIAFDMNGPTVGSTFQLQLTQSTDVEGSGTDSGQTITGDNVVAGNIQTVAGNLAVTNAGTVVNGAVVPGLINQAAGSFRVAADAQENIVLNSLMLTPSGTGNDQTDATVVKFWVDNDQSGTMTAGDVQIDATPTVFAGNNTTTTFTFTSGVTISANSSKDILVTYDMAPGTVGGNTFQLTVPAQGGVGSGGTSSVTVKTPAAAVGPTRTATGTFMAALGAVNPATGAVDLSDSTAEVLAIDFTAGPNSGIYLDFLRLTPDGTLNDNTGLAAVKFYWDTGTAGIVDGEAQITSLPAQYTANDTATLFDFRNNNAPASLLVPAGQSKTLLVAYDFVDGAPAGATLRTAVAAAADVVASEQVSGLSVSPTLTGAVTGNFLTTRNGAAIAPGPFNPIAQNIRSSALNQPLLQFTVTAGPNENVTLYSMALTPAGTGDDRSDITQVKLYRDNGATAGSVDSGDTQVVLTTAKFDADETKTAFLVAGTETVTLNTTQTYLVVADFANTATAGETFKVALSQSADLQLRGVTSGQVFAPSGGAINGNPQTIRGGLTFAEGTANPAAATHGNATDNVPVLQVRLTADNSAIVQMETLALTPASPAVACSGNTQFDDMVDVNTVRFFDDVNNNGVADDTEVEMVPNPTGYSADGTGQIFTFGTPFQLAAGATKNLLVTYNLAGTAKACEAFSASVTLSTSMTAKEVGTGSSAIVSGSVAGNTQTIGGKVTVTLGANTPLSTAGISPNQENAPIFQFAVTADNAEAVQIEKIAITPAGTANDVTDLSATAAVDVKFYYDTDGDGVVDTGELQLTTTPAVFSTDDTKRIFTLDSPFQVSASQTVNILVAYNVGTPTTGKTFQASLSPSADLTVRGVSSSTIIVPTGTAAGNFLTVTGPLTAATGANPPAARVVNKTATKVGVLQFTIAPGSENALLESLALTPSGTGNDQLQITKVRLYEDSDADGVVDVGETELVLTASTYTADNTKTTFPLAAPFTIAAANTKTFLVAYDMNASINGSTFAVSIASAADLKLRGETSGQLMPVTLNPGGGLNGNAITIGGALSVAVGAANPASMGVSPGIVNQPVMQLQFTATEESVDITSIALTPTGTADDQNSLTDPVNGRVDKVRFFVDANANGVVDTGETEVVPNTNPSVFANDNTRQVFTLPVGAGGLQITGGQTKTVLVAYNLAAYTNSLNPAPLNGTLAVQMTLPADVTAQSASNASAITAMPENTTLQSNTLTFAGSLAVALSNSPAATNVATASSDIPVLRFDAAAISESVTITKVVVTGAGTIDEKTDLTNIRLYRDNGATANTLDATDTLVGTATSFTANDGTATITLTTPVTLTVTAGTQDPSISEGFFITASLNGNETAAETIILKLAGASAVQGTGVTTAQAISLLSTTSLTSNAMKVVGALGVSKGTNTPASTIAKSQSAAPVLQVILSAGPAENVTIASIQITPAGTGDDLADVDAVKFYLDTDSDGVVDSGETLLSTTPVKFGGNDTVTAFNFTGGLVISKSANVALLVAYQTNANPAAGASYQASVANAAAVTATGQTSGLPAVISGSATGNALFLDSTAPQLATTNPALASDGTTKLDAIDDDDTVTFTFTKAMRAVSVTASNINSVLTLNNSHTWLAGGASGTINSATWKTNNTVLEIKLAANATNPATVAVGDTVTLSTGFFVDAAGNPLATANAVITGNFDQKAPKLLAAPAGVVLNSLGEVDLKFDEKLDAVSANTKTNFAIAGIAGAAANDTVTITSATLQTDQITVRLRFTGMSNLPNEAYKVTINGVKDLAVTTPNATSGETQNFTQNTTGLYTKLLVVPPGMTFTAGAAPSGTPTQPVVGKAYDVKLYAVDDNFNVVAGITNTVQVTISPVSVLTGDTNAAAKTMVAGTTTISLTFDATGAFSMGAVDQNNAQAQVVAPAGSNFANGATGNLSNSTKIFATLQPTVSNGVVIKTVNISGQDITVLQHDNTNTTQASTQIPADGSTPSTVYVKLVDDAGVPLQNVQVRLLVNGAAPLRVASGTARGASATATVALPNNSNALINTDANGEAMFKLSSTSGGSFTIQPQANDGTGAFKSMGTSFPLAFRTVSAAGGDGLQVTVTGDVFNVNQPLQIIAKVGDPDGINTANPASFELYYPNDATAHTFTYSCTPSGTALAPVTESLCTFTPTVPAGGWVVGPNAFRLRYRDVNNQIGAGFGEAQQSDLTFTLTGVSGFALTNVMNVPNPFNPATSGTACTMAGTQAATLKCTDLTFQSSQDISSVLVVIYNSLGRPVKQISFNDTAGLAGIGFNKSVQWDGTDNGGALVATGIYYYELRAVSTNGAVSTASGKIALIR